MPDTPEHHEHRVFYNYLSREVAWLTLSTMTTRWSSPRLYNDPFDTPNNISFTFQLEAVPAIAMMVMQLIVDEPARGMPREASVVEAIEAARAAPNTEQKLIALVGAATKAGMEANEYLRLTNAMWSTKLEVMRLFCVSEVFDDLLMWAHYAESHRGVVLGLRCTAGSATNLCAARRVAYSRQLPLLEDTALDWVCRYFDSNMIKGVPDAEQRRAYDAMTLTKSDHWTYEKEWRCFGDEDYDCLAVSPKHKDDLVRIVPLQPDEVDAVYVGCRMPPEDERDLRRLVKERLRPDTKVLRGRRVSARSALSSRNTGAHACCPAFPTRACGPTNAKALRQSRPGVPQRYVRLLDLHPCRDPWRCSGARPGRRCVRWFRRPSVPASTEPPP